MRDRAKPCAGVARAKCAGGASEVQNNILQETDAKKRQAEFKFSLPPTAEYLPPTNSVTKKFTLYAETNADERANSAARGTGLLYVNGYITRR